MRDEYDSGEQRKPRWYRAARAFWFPVAYGLGAVLVMGLHKIADPSISAVPAQVQTTTTAVSMLIVGFGIWYYPVAKGWIEPPFEFREAQQDG